MASENAGSKKLGTKHKPLSDFVLRNTSCPDCGKRIDLREIRENVCPSCGTFLSVTAGMIRKAHELAAEEILNKEHKKKNKQAHEKSDAKSADANTVKKPVEKKIASEFDDKIECGTFIFTGKKNKEFMMLERKKKSYLCLPVIRDTDYEEGQYVQRAYKDRLVVLSEAVNIAPIQITGIKARLSNELVNNILEKYRGYIPKAKAKAKGNKSGVKNAKADPNNYRRSGDGLYDGNAWTGLAMTTTHIKIFRG